MSKLNFTSFSFTELTAKLLVCVREYKRNESTLLQDRTKFDEYCDKFIKANFQYEAKHYPVIKVNLQLYLLGNEDNKFSKVINENCNLQNA